MQPALTAWPRPLTVCPAKLAGADHVDDVQEAVVGLVLGPLLAQLHGAAGVKEWQVMPLAHTLVESRQPLPSHEQDRQNRAAH